MQTKGSYKMSWIACISVNIDYWFIRCSCQLWCICSRFAESLLSVLLLLLLSETWFLRLMSDVNTTLCERLNCMMYVCNAPPPLCSGRRRCRVWRWPTPWLLTTSWPTRWRRSVRRTPTWGGSWRTTPTTCPNWRQRPLAWRSVWVLQQHHQHPQHPQHQQHQQHQLHYQCGKSVILT